jgi:hypothetical protein
MYSTFIIILCFSCYVVQFILYYFLFSSIICWYGLLQAIFVQYFCVLFKPSFLANYITYYIVYDGMCTVYTELSATKAHSDRCTLLLFLNAFSIFEKKSQHIYIHSVHFLKKNPEDAETEVCVVLASFSCSHFVKYNTSSYICRDALHVVVCAQQKGILVSCIPFQQNNVQLCFFL